MAKEKIGFMASLGFSKMEPGEVLDILSRIGYRAVEWTLAHLDPRRKSLSEIKGIVRLTGKHGLEISEAVVQQDLVIPDRTLRRQTVDFVLRCIRTFSEAGIPAINLFTGPRPWEPGAPRINRTIAEGEAWNLVYRAFDLLVPEAEKRGINLAVEGV